MLTDAQWMRLEPLIEACRPKGKTPPQDLRRTLSAIVWRHENGAKWRAIPADLGPWSRAAQMFIRWARLGVWERLLLLAQDGPGARGPAWDDVSGRHQHPGASESSRGGPKRGSPAERDQREALGRSRGGYGTKACVIADGCGRAVAFVLAPRPAIPSKQNEAPVACPDWIYANRNHVERLWARLKEWRAIATRYEKTASSFMGVLCLAAALDWLKP